MAASDDMLELTVWFHPSMQIPVKIDTKAHPFKVPGSIKVVDLMEKAEDFFIDVTEKAGEPLELQINVLWNVKDHKKALNPNETLSMHFASGESFGVYGDIFPVSKPAAQKPEEEKIPVTILTGFLGSGKTTLLNYILQEQKEKKIAIIENEFGEISIDDALLTQNKLDLAEKVVVMDNGCMCCTIRGDLVKGLMSIVEDIKNGGQIDQIMIETTGMADPVPIVRTFMSSPELTDDLRLDAVVTMADTKHLVARLDDKIEEGAVNEAYQQIAFADKIILNKLDLITTEEAIVVKDRIREINKYAKVLGAIKGRVRMSELVNIRAHDMSNFINADIEAEAVDDIKDVKGASGNIDKGHDENCTEDHGDGGHSGGHGHAEGHGGGHGHGHSEGHGGGHGGGGGNDGHGDAFEGTAHGKGHGPAQGKDPSANRHDTRVNSFAIVREGEILPRKLSMWMAAIGQLPPKYGTIFRIKAILAVQGHPYKHVFHAVMDVSDEDDAGEWAEGEKKVCKIVFIGKSMDQAYLRKGFESIFA